ncbi:JAB domain-containing protein [Nocardia asteroides]|uniref:DNA repair protein RadC n=1 Tax=Nocardia asteroides NBRC 15531 TaxID=1110697 RepID=U5EMZ0_NOCAS|nr:DNA repair protein RadC [Nocardia asteroides]UGT47597.1 DNA repair protein RadC [Nocardia asteroides]GAD87731.1 DNA repair protein RadC [Nocardia asteroides NBRC 15531]SFM49631.1 DNA replication and repair protein RadC [Nocardia asteroides]VEG33490.1 DNA repair protein RadC [Nocardia asteroides]
MSVPITNLPVAQRPRERLLLHGPQALSDVELLALLLGQGTRGRSALELAAELLGEYTGLAELAGARPEELARRAGIGPAKAATVIAAFHLGSRTRTTAAAPQLTAPADIASVAVPLFAGARVERLLVLICDARHRLRHRAFVAEGAIDRVAVPVREILNTVLRHDGRAFAVVHNHPSGDPAPSDDDRRASSLLAGAADTVGLRYLDHIVVAGETWATAPPLT